MYDQERMICSMLNFIMFIIMIGLCCGAGPKTVKLQSMYLESFLHVHEACRLHYTIDIMNMCGV